MPSFYQCLRRCTFLELENRCPSSKISIRERSHMTSDQRNKLIVEVLECNVLTNNLIPGVACEPAPYCDGANASWNGFKHRLSRATLMTTRQAKPTGQFHDWFKKPS
ncbi:hypothetical protein AVEN_90875-1 [Araneus ventricosus]|uniref:Uncharacterized protein n=1 Tax=Araneus ventricosus TaxID=182803 RepID=A0A4Y2P3B1_ARAVE|nr:hypothetical protein AVEN_90875-1 [Araneus ventricosus]